MSVSLNKRNKGQMVLLQEIDFFPPYCTLINALSKDKKQCFYDGKLFQELADDVLADITLSNDRVTQDFRSH